MGWIELAPEDREKYGAPERIPFIYGRWGLKAIDALEAQVIEVPVGEDKPRGWTVEDLHNGMRRRLRDADGNVVQEPELDDEGNQVLDGEGKPKMRDAISSSQLAIAAVVWLALWSDGIRVPWRDFDVSPTGLHIQWGDEEGKAQESKEG